MGPQNTAKKRKAQPVDEKPTKKAKKVAVKEISVKVPKVKSSKADAESTKSKTTIEKKPIKSLSKPKKPQPEEDKIIVEQDSDDSDSPDEDDQTAALLAGFESSSDEEGDASELADTDVEIKNVPNPPSTALQKAANAATEDRDKPGVIYVGRVPHGFFEHQMRAYFSQFGDINRLRLSRNRRTGASRHYAFVEFSSSEVAAIVAETMNNYLLFGHLLKVNLLTPEQIHPNLFKGAGKRFKRIPWNRIERFNIDKTDRAGWEKRVSREQKRRKAKEEKLKDLGYEFEIPTLQAVESVPMQSAIEVEGNGPALLEAKESTKPALLENVLNGSQAGTKAKEGVKVVVNGKRSKRTSTK